MTILATGSGVRCRLAMLVLTLMCGTVMAAPGSNGPAAKKPKKAVATSDPAPTTPPAALDGPTISLGGAPAFSLTNPFDRYQTASASTATDDPFRPSLLQGSLTGTPGLWSTQFAETLAPGEASSSVYVQRYSRVPGGLVVTDVNTGWTVGVTKWLELSFATTPYRRIRLTHPGELTFGPRGTFGSFNAQSPFVRNALVHGPVDWSLGATIGLLSQDRGDKIGLALQFSESIPYNPDFNRGAAIYGVGTTEPTFVENVLVDKWLGHVGEMAFNAGYQHNGTIDAGGKVRIPLRDQFNYGFGEIFPLRSRLQGIVELNGSVPFGAGVSGDPFENPRPVDVTGGIRFNPITWMGINAGYRYAANAPRTNVSGFVFGLSFGPPPAAPVAAPPPPTPTLACQVDTSPVQPGATVHVTSTVTPQGLPYTYSWTTTGGKLAPSNDTAALDTTGLAPGMYTVTGRVDNGSGGTADCQANVEVREAPRNPPTATCSVSPDSVLPGAALTFSAQAASPDNRPLTYAWEVSAGHPDTTTAATLHDDTTGAAPGPVTGTLKVSDDRGLSTTCSAQATIEQPPPPPQAALATTLQFKPNSSRVDNAAKAALDDVALRLQQDATAKAVIVGFATSTEVEHRRALTPAATLRLAEERAVNAKAYLVSEKGIASDRIEVRHDDGPQKAEVWIVPQGASYTGSGQTFDENAVKPAPVRRSRRRGPATTGKG